MSHSPVLISDQEEKAIQQLFFDAFLEDTRFEQTHEAIFTLAHDAFLAGYQAAKDAYLHYKGGSK